MEKTNRFCCLIFFVLTPLTLSAQNRAIDSLKSALAMSGKHEDFKILWELSYEYIDIDSDLSFKYVNDSYTSAVRAGDSLYITKAGRLMGRLLRYMGKLKEATSILNSSLEIAERNNFVRECANISNVLANTYVFLFEYDKALEFNFKALVLQEKEGDPKRVSLTLLNIGFIYYRMGSITEALDYFDRSLRLKLDCGDQFDLDKLYYNIGFCHSANRDVKRSRIFFEKALTTCRPDCSNTTMYLVELGLAQTFIIEENYKQAEVHYLKSLENSQINGDERIQIEVANELIVLYFLKDDLNKAGFYFKYIEALPEHQNSFYNVNFFKLKAEYYERLGNFKLANSFQKKYSNAIEKETGNERSLSLVKVKAQFLERENIARINEQRQRLILKEQALHQQQMLNVLIGAVIILTITIIIILIKANRRKQAINELLDQRVKERTKELERNRDELEHTHNEQAVILKKVSSDLVASLATIKGLSEIATAELPQNEAVHFKKAESMTERMVDYMRNYSNGEMHKN